MSRQQLIPIRLVALAAGLALALGAPFVRAADGPTAEREAVYAAFTVNLVRFVTWPAAALGKRGTPFLIGTFPRDPINPELDSAAQGESVDGHPIRTVRLYRPQDARKCHMVFISSEAGDVRTVLSRVNLEPVLTVSDTSGFLAMGGHVRFVSEPPHTRLEISANNLRASGLRARAQLLQIGAMP